MHKQGVAYDGKRSIIDIIFPSDDLVVGTNQLNFLINRKDGSVAQSPVLKYTVWEGLTTESSIEANSNYPLLIDLINSVNKSLNDTNVAIGAMNSALNSIGNSTINADKAAEKAILAANNADSKVDEKIGDVNRALAAGTVDLELKEARKDANGVVHDTVKQRLDSELIVGDKSLKDFVIDMDGMKESQDLAYETYIGYKVCQNTQNGVVKDLNIYGKSLVSAWKISDWMKVNTQIVATDKVGTSVMQIMQKDNIFNVGDVITVVADILVDNPTNCYWQVNYMSTTGEEKSLKNISFSSGIKSFTAKLPSDYSHMRCIFVGFQAGNTRTFKNNGCMCIKGDLGGFVPSYFEGIASVGNGNEIEVLSRKENGNLFNINDFKDIVINLGANPNSFVIKDGRNCWMPIDYGIYHKDFKYYLNFKPNTQYKLKFDYFFETSTNSHGIYFRAVYTDGTFDYPLRGAYNSWGVSTLITNGNKTVDYIHMTYTDSGTKTWIDLDSIVIAESKYYNDKLENKQDKKNILYKDSNSQWKHVMELNEWDILDTINNKYYINSLRTILNNKDKLWRDNGTDKGGFKTYWRSYDNFIIDKCICNKLKVYDVAVIREEKCIFFNKAKDLLYITIPTSECASLSNLDTWFVSNNIEVVIPAKKEEYEINPIYPESYDSETMILIYGGVVAPNASFKITSSLPSFLNNIEDRVSRLENEIYKTNLANFTVALNALDTKLRLDRLEAPQQ